MNLLTKAEAATSLSKRINKIRAALVFVLLIGLVFHAPMVTVWNDNIGAYNTIFRAWKEILVVILAAISLPALIKKISTNKITRSKILLSVAFYVFLTLLIATTTYSGVATIMGARINLVPIMLLIIGFSLDKKYLIQYKKTILVLGLLVAISIFAQLVLPRHWFIFDTIGSDSFKVANIQDSNVARLHGILSGPLQASSYLVLWFGLWLFYFKKHNTASVSAMLLGVLAIYLTYSRAALSGVAVIILFYLSKKTKISSAKITAITLAGIISLVVFGAIALNYKPLSLIVFHAPPEKALTESSTSDHFKYPYRAARLLIKNPVGYGLGSAGPASWFSKKPLMTENYYLQISLEIGALGLAAILVFFWQIAKGLDRNKELGLLAAFLALSAMSFLLHTWTDTATVWTFWLLAGTSLGPTIFDRQQKSQQ